MSKKSIRRGDILRVTGIWPFLEPNSLVVAADSPNKEGRLTVRFQTPCQRVTLTGVRETVLKRVGRLHPEYREEFLGHGKRKKHG